MALHRGASSRPCSTSQAARSRDGLCSGLLEDVDERRAPVPSSQDDRRPERRLRGLRFGGFPAGFGRKTLRLRTCGARCADPRRLPPPALLLPPPPLLLPLLSLLSSTRKRWPRTQRLAAEVAVPAAASPSSRPTPRRALGRSRPRSTAPSSRARSRRCVPAEPHWSWLADLGRASSRSSEAGKLVGLVERRSAGFSPRSRYPRMPISWAAPCTPWT
jgi:hypothetical protein